MRFSKVDKAETRDRGAGVKKGDVAASNVEDDKYIAAAVGMRLSTPLVPPPRATQ